MKKQIVESALWPVPEWHKDFGDTRVELEHLRALGIALLEALPDAHVDLELPEPGLMNLVVEMPDGSSAEVYSVAANTPGQRRYGVFFAPGTPDEREVYHELVENAVKCFTNAGHAG